MGNMRKQPLSGLVLEYKADSHPICAPFIESGPALLAKQYDLTLDKEYVDECHFCYIIRRTIVDRFPEYLSPGQVCGLEEK